MVIHEFSPRLWLSRSHAFVGKGLYCVGQYTLAFRGHVSGRVDSDSENFRRPKGPLWILVFQRGVHPLTTFLDKIQEIQKRPIESDAKTFPTIPLCSDARAMVIASHVSVVDCDMAILGIV